MGMCMAMRTALRQYGADARADVEGGGLARHVLRLLRLGRVQEADLIEASGPFEMISRKKMLRFICGEWMGMPGAFATPAPNATGLPLVPAASSPTIAVATSATASARKRMPMPGSCLASAKWRFP